MSKENNHFKNENEEELPEKLKDKEQDFDIVLILGSDEKFFKKYKGKIHPEIIQNKFLRLMLKHQIDEFNSNNRYLSWETVFEEVYPEKRKEEPYKENYMKLAKKYIEEISTQSPELLEKRLRSLLEKKETERAVAVFKETGNIEALYKHLDHAKNVGSEDIVELVSKDLSKISETVELLDKDEHGFGRLPKGGITMIAGKGGVGKGAFSTGCIGTLITTGGFFMGIKLEQGCFFLVNEEDLEPTAINRIINNKGDIQKFEWLELPKDSDGYSQSFSLKHHIPALKRKLMQYPKETLTNSLLLIDSLDDLAGMAKGIDAYNPMEARNLLKPLKRLARDFNMVVIIIANVSKDSNSELIRTILNSKAFTDVCRAVYIIIEDEEEKERHHLLPLKWNIPELKNTGIEFRIEELTDKITIVKELSAEDVEALRAERQPGQSRTLGAGERARTFLEEKLKGGGGKPKVLVKIAEESLVCSRDTLYKKMRELKKKGLTGVIEDGFGNPIWVWIAPPTETKESSEKTEVTQNAEKKVNEIREKHQTEE